MSTEALTLEQRALTYPEKAKGLVVKDQETVTTANNLLLEIKRMAKEVSDTFDPLIQEAHEHHRSLLGKKKEYMEPLEQAEQITKGALRVYLAEQERKRQEEEAARQRAEAERKRLEEESMKKAQEAELRAKTAKDEETRKAAQAEVDQIIEVAAKKEAEIPSIPVTAFRPKTQGLTMKKIYKARVINEALIPREYLSVDMVKINKVVQILKDKTSIPGVEVFAEDQLAARIS